MSVRVGQVTWLVVLACLAAAPAGSMAEAPNGQAVTAVSGESPAASETLQNQALESRPIRVRAGGGVGLPGLTSQGHASGPWTLWLQTAVVLAVVLAAMWLVLKWLRKSGIGGSFGGANSAVQVLNRGFLTSKHQVILVRFGGRLLLVGVGPQSVNVLSEISSPDEAATILGKVEGAKPGSSSRDFEQAINEAAGAYGEQPMAAADRPGVQTPTQEQIGEIRGEIRSLLAKMQSVGKRP